MYLLAFFILQNVLKKILELIQSYEDVRHFWAQNGSFVLSKFFLVQTIVITFIYVLVLSIGQNLKKFLQRIQNYDDGPFLGPKWSICPKQIFFRKIIIIILIYLLGPFIVQNSLKKFFQWI